MQEDSHGLFRLEEVLAIADYFIFERSNRPNGRGRLQPQCLLESGIEVLEFGKMLQLNWTGAADLVHFAANSLICPRRGKEVVEEERKHSRSGLMSGDQEGDELVADVLMGKTFA
jgi:hypothetical protein